MKSSEVQVSLPRLFLSFSQTVEYAVHSPLPKIYTRKGSAESFVTFSKDARKRSVIATRFKCNLVALAAERVFRRTYLEFICASHSTRNFMFGFKKLRNSSHERITILGNFRKIGLASQGTRRSSEISYQEISFHFLVEFIQKTFLASFTTISFGNFQNFWLNGKRLISV